MKRRRKKASSKFQRRAEREASHFTKREASLFGPLFSEPYRYDKARMDESIPGDLRRFHPGHLERHRRLDGRLPLLTIKTTSKSRRGRPKTHDRIAYHRPNWVSVCARRMAKRVALFALGQIGVGRGAKKYLLKIPRRRNRYSHIKC